MSLIFLFIDGVGLGEEKENNPFYQSDYPGFSAVTGGSNFSKNAEEVIEDNHIFKPLDATLGVAGLPQSGTGQTTLFSGENAAKEIGKHFGPFPHSGIKHLLEEESLFIKAQKLGVTCEFMNAYPDIFFRKAEKRNRWSCTTLMTKSAGIPLNTTKEVRESKALTAGLTQKAWKEQLNIDVPELTPEEAGDVLINKLVNFDLLLFEYYLTDKAGHDQDMKKADRYIKRYDRFLWYLIKHKPAEATIVLSSDHGNVEDLSVKTHTFNDVPLFVYGLGTDHFKDAESILDVTPAILDTLAGERKNRDKLIS